MPARKRIRRDREAARQAILEVAEKHLREGGPEAVRVQRVASDLGITDAAVHHHFGSREGLLEALLRFAARRLRAEQERILADWDGDPERVEQLAEMIADTYAVQGHARLALWLALGGRESAGSGLFEPLVDAVHRARIAAARERGVTPPRRQSTRYDVALLNVALAAEPIFGHGFLRSVGLAAGSDDRDRFRRWLVRRLAGLLRPGSDLER